MTYTTNERYQRKRGCQNNRRSRQDVESNIISRRRMSLWIMVLLSAIAILSSDDGMILQVHALLSTPQFTSHVQNNNNIRIRHAAATINTKNNNNIKGPFPTKISQQSRHSTSSAVPTTRTCLLQTPISSDISRGGAAAAAGWLFTPDRTAGVIADTVKEGATVVAETALEAAAYAADTAATVTTETVVQTIYKAPFLSLAISFIAGGLLFSTVAAFVAATYSFGKENSRRIREVAGILMRRNWSVIRMQWMFTLDVLRGKEQISGFKNRFPAALQTFKDGFTEVKRVFTESVDAIKKETQMYSAAVGLPGLIPIQYIFERIFPTFLTHPFRGAFEEACVNMVNDNNQIRSLTLKEFSMGDIAPRILEARLFDLGPNDMAFDLDMRWRSNACATLDMRVASFGTTKIPVTIQNLRFEGPVRLILVGLMPVEPGWQALLISFPRPPQIGFDLKVAGGLITQIPWLRNEVAKNLDNAVAQEMLWPRRAVVSAPAPFKPKMLLNPMQILSLMRDDPLLRRERELMNSIPDDFRNSFEKDFPDPSDIDVEIRQIGNGTKAIDDDEDEDDVNGTGGVGSLFPKRLRFWNRGEQHTTQVADTLQLMVETLKEEATATSNGRAMPVMIMEGVEEPRGIFRRVLGNILIPRSLLSYASREAG